MRVHTRTTVHPPSNPNHNWLDLDVTLDRRDARWNLAHKSNPGWIAGGWSEVTFEWSLGSANAKGGGGRNKRAAAAKAAKAADSAPGGNDADAASGPKAATKGSCRKGGGLGDAPTSFLDAVEIDMRLSVDGFKPTRMLKTRAGADVGLKGGAWVFSATRVLPPGDIVYFFTIAGHKAKKPVDTSPAADGKINSFCVSLAFILISCKHLTHRCSVASLAPVFRRQAKATESRCKHVVAVAEHPHT